MSPVSSPLECTLVGVLSDAEAEAEAVRERKRPLKFKTRLMLPNMSPVLAWSVGRLGEPEWLRELRGGVRGVWNLMEDGARACPGAPERGVPGDPVGLGTGIGRGGTGGVESFVFSRMGPKGGEVAEEARERVEWCLRVSSAH